MADTQRALPTTTGEVVPSGWSAVGAAAPALCIDEVTADGDTTHILIEADDVYTVPLLPVVDPLKNTGHAVVINFAGGSGARGSFAWALRQGAFGIVNDNTGTGVADEYSEYSLALTEGQAANITNYSNLFLDITSILDGDPSLKITQAHLLTPPRPVRITVLGA